MRLSLAAILLLLAAALPAEESPWEYGGHGKLRAVGQSFPDNSVLRDVAGSTSLDAIGELRLNLSGKHEGWSLQADYQLLGLSSEFLDFRLPSDSARLFDFTSIITDGSETALVHRLDRLWVGWAGEKVVVRAGRQALSWGNGLFFSPMDLVNPFDPTTIDTEYKTGDDMLYAQYLRDNGDDLQAAVVWRRNPVTGDVESEQGTMALKYHGFADEREYDVLVARDFDETVIGLGAAGNLGGAIWRGDVVVTDGDSDTRVEIVANLSYSWTWGDHNVSGTAELYHDGDDRNYFAGSVLIELSPLWTVTPTLVSNLDDPSGLLQLVTQYSLGDDITFLGSINVPLGASGTEFGGPESGLPGRYFSYDMAVFAQLAWYF